MEDLQRYENLTILVSELKSGDEIFNGLIWVPVRATVASAILPGWVVVYIGPMGFALTLHEAAPILARRKAK